MKINYVKLASAVNIPVRLALGAGVGMFVHKAAKIISENESTPAKVVTWLGAFCAAWATCHAVDCWCDKAVGICQENQKLQDTIRDSKVYFGEE